MVRLQPYFPKSHGKPRVDDRRVLSGIIFVNRNGLRWRGAAAAYGPHKILYNLWKRWSAVQSRQRKDVSDQAQVFIRRGGEIVHHELGSFVRKQAAFGRP